VGGSYTIEGFALDGVIETLALLFLISQLSQSVLASSSLNSCHDGLWLSQIQSKRGKRILSETSKLVYQNKPFLY
jgi:hypothetical protein